MSINYLSQKHVGNSFCLSVFKFLERRERDKVGGDATCALVLQNSALVAVFMEEPFCKFCWPLSVPLLSPAPI